MKQRGRGFTLLEVLVALLLLALTFSALLRIFSGGLRNVVVAEDYAGALMVAQSRLASTGVESPLIEGDSEGRDAAGYDWSVTVRRQEDFAPPLDGATRLLDIYLVAVEVSWQDGAHLRGFKLATMKTALRQ